MPLHAATNRQRARPHAAEPTEIADRRAWALLLDQSDAIADRITATLFEHDRHVYEDFDPELRADVRDSTREHVRRGLGALAGETVQMAGSRETWRETGRRRARQGVPLEVVLNAYTTGARILWEALVAKARSDAAVGIDAAQLIRAAQAVWANLDRQNAMLIEAYRREAARLHRQDLQRQQVVIEGLLEGRGADPDFAVEARGALGIGADVPVACVVVLAERSPLEALGPVEDRLERLGVQVYWHVRGETYLGLLAGPLPSTTELAELLDGAQAGRVGLGASVGGVAGFATAFWLASRAAETLPRGHPGVATVTDRLPEVLLAGSPQMVPLLVSETLGPLLSLPEGQRRSLLDTVAALLRHDGSPTHASEDLYCHRNTVIYRQRQIEELTGRSLTDPRDKLLLSLALLACPGRADNEAQPPV